MTQDEKQQEIERLTASLREVRERKDQRITELVQRVTTLTQEKDALAAELKALRSALEGLRDDLQD